MVFFINLSRFSFTRSEEAKVEVEKCVVAQESTELWHTADSFGGIRM